MLKKSFEPTKISTELKIILAFLKDDQIVNAIFLKRPERIEALGLILLISLLVWRLVEHFIRTELEDADTTLAGWEQFWPTN